MNENQHTVEVEKGNTPEDYQKDKDPTLEDNSKEQEPTSGENPKEKDTTPEEETTLDKQFSVYLYGISWKCFYLEEIHMKFICLY